MDQVEEAPRFLEPEDLGNCYFAREFTARAGYGASEANSLISNFKKARKYQHASAWRWRNLAVQQFATELDSLIGDADVTIMPIPSSSLPGDEEYNNRFEDLLDRWEQLRKLAGRPCGNDWAIRRRHRVTPAHQGKKPRSVQDAYDSFRWSGFTRTAEAVVLVDDVITCGTQFKACQRLLRENGPNVQVFGAFWARTIWIDPEAE
jgi:predicted amidophosphoribosyltransferase